MCKLSKGDTIVTIFLEEHTILKNFEGIANKTIHYKLILTFMEDRPIEVLETNSKTTTKKRV